MRQRRGTFRAVHRTQSQSSPYQWQAREFRGRQEDIRTGTDVETLSNYSLPYWMRRGKHLRNEALAAEWRALREVSCKYRFGRVELLPIKKTKEAFARYLGKYLTKTFNLIEPGRKHRLVRYSRGIGRHLSIRFSIRGLGNLLYRTRLKMAAAMLNFKDYGYFADFFGRAGRNQSRRKRTTLMSGR
ncbi:MAG: hypothetical protein WBN75_09945 [Verrucomicrobiia bacterium]